MDIKMNKEKFLTRRWNTIISVALGVPTFTFAIYGLVSPIGETREGMIVLSVLGALFWLVLEYHTSARFAWLQKISIGTKDKPKLIGLALTALVAHNLIYWFFLIPFLTPLSYRTGFVIYSIILLSRFIANTIINLQDFSPEQYYKFSFRIPWDEASGE